MRQLAIGLGHGSELGGRHRLGHELADELCRLAHVDGAVLVGHQAGQIAQAAGVRAGLLGGRHRCHGRFIGLACELGPVHLTSALANQEGLLHLLDLGGVQAELLGVALQPRLVGLGLARCIGPAHSDRAGIA